MDSLPLPSTAYLENATALVAVFGQANLYDAELRALRLDLAASDPALEVDFHLPGDFAVAVPASSRAAEYRITLRCTGVESVAVTGLYPQNVVGAYAIEPLPASNGTAARVRMSVQGTVGCDLDVCCARVVVASVTGLGAA